MSVFDVLPLGWKGAVYVYDPPMHRALPDLILRVFLGVLLGKRRQMPVLFGFFPIPT